MLKKYVIRLSADERHQLEALIRSGNAPAQTQTHARILLKADCSASGPAWTDATIAEAWFHRHGQPGSISQTGSRSRWRGSPSKRVRGGGATAPMRIRNSLDAPGTSSHLPPCNCRDAAVPCR